MNPSDLPEGSKTMSESAPRLSFVGDSHNVSGRLSHVSFDDQPKVVYNLESPRIDVPLFQPCLSIFYRCFGLTVVMTVGITIGWVLSCVIQNNSMSFPYGNLDIFIGVFTGGCSIIVIRFIGEIVLLFWDRAAKKEQLTAIKQRQLSMGESSTPSRYPKKWVKRLSQWRVNKTNADNRFNERKHGFEGWIRALLFYILYFMFLVLIIFSTIMLAPSKSLPHDSFIDILQIVYLSFNVVRNSAFGLFMLLSFFLEFLLFLIAVFAVTWPHSGFFSKASKSYSAALLDASSIESQKVESTCLLIACHHSALTEERASSLRRVLTAAVAIFPPEAIFVIDNSNDVSPVDNTMELCEEVSMTVNGGSKKINYVFIPEGNKTLGLYWVTEKYISVLVAKGICENFKYCVITDDDVPLPSTMKFPYSELNKDSGIKAVAYVISAVSEASNSNNILVGLQDFEYKFAGLLKQMQVKCGGSTLCAHGAVSLWSRDILGDSILYHHDQVFHGEDLYMGMLLHRLQLGYRIIVSAEDPVATFCPTDLATLFRQRARSWDLCAHRKLLSIFKMFWRYWSRQYLILKPFLLLDTIAGVMDWFKMFFLCIYCIVDPVTMGVVTLLFFFISYIQSLLFNFICLRYRPDLRISASVLIIMPLYRTMSYVFRLYALLENVLTYSIWSIKTPTISERYMDENSLPPVPAITAEWPYCDWRNVWKEELMMEDGDGVEDGDGLVIINPSMLQWVDSLCSTQKIKARDAAFQNGMCHVIRSLVVLMKLRLENEWLHATDIRDMMQELCNRLDIRAMELTATSWAEVSLALKAAVKQWDADKSFNLLEFPVNTFDTKSVLTANLNILRRVRIELSLLDEANRQSRVQDVIVVLDRRIADLSSRVLF